MDLFNMSKEDEEKVENLASQVFRQSQNRLLVQLRFLDLAIGQFNNSTFTNFLIPTYKTNGQIFVYNPLYVINQYKQNKNNVTRDFLHVVFHCLFRHMFVCETFNPSLWDLSCDIAIENMINDLELDCLEVPKCVEQRRQINKLRGKVKYITAECLYDYFTNNAIDDETLSMLSDLFFVDYHDDWYVKEQSSEGSSKGKKEQKDKDKNKSDDSQNNNEDSQNSDNKEDEEQDEGEKESSGEASGDEGEEDENNDSSSSSNGGDEEEKDGDSSDSNNGEGDNNSSSNEPSSSPSSSNNKSRSLSQSELQDLQDHWKDISEKVQVDLETFNKERGDNANSIMQNLKEVNREKYDYTSFLKKFATMGEVMKINDDEFDYVYYTYGLSVYKNMPLVEPLEYKDVKRIKDFVIAIDTSGSVEGDLVQTFLQKTYNILKSTESFFQKINLHIIQCDAEIHEDKKITSQREFDDYIKNMELVGFGGTDFRPVFDYVDELIDKKEFDNLKGLIYFTDGCGTYPLSKPQYQTAFVFIEDNEYNDYEVPSWAVKLILEKKDI